MNKIITMPNGRPVTGRDIAMQLDILERDGYHAAMRQLDDILHMDLQARDLLKLRTDAARTQDLKKARSAWTAWCITWGVVPKTDEYNNTLDALRLEFDKDVDPEWMGAYLYEYYGMCRK